MSLGEAGDWMPLRGSSTKRIWGGFALMKKGISWPDLHHIARSIVTFGKINWKVSKTTRLSIKMWSFHQEIVSPSLFQIWTFEKLCGLGCLFKPWHSFTCMFPVTFQQETKKKYLRIFALDCRNFNHRMFDKRRWKKERKEGHCLSVLCCLIVVRSWPKMQRQYFSKSRMR